MSTLPPSVFSTEPLQLTRANIQPWTGIQRTGFGFSSACPSSPCIHRSPPGDVRCKRRMGAALLGLALCPDGSGCGGCRCLGDTGSRLPGRGVLRLVRRIGLIGFDLCLGAEPVLEIFAIGSVLVLPDEVGPLPDFRREIVVHILSPGLISGSDTFQGFIVRAHMGADARVWVP